MADRRLQVFHAVAKHRSFTKAAEALFMTQPAVTFQIKQLEEQHNTRLFERAHGRIALTPAGEVVLEYAERILGLSAELDLRLKELTGGISGPLLVGASKTVAEYLLPRVLGEFRSQHPSVQPRLCVENSETVQARVAAHTLDVGFIESGAPAPGVDADVCGDDELVVACAPGHALAGERRIAARQLLGHAFLRREPGSGTREVTDRFLRDGGVDPDALETVMELGSPESLKRLAATGLGFTILSRSAMTSELRLGVLVAVPLSPRLERRLSVVYPKERFRSKLVTTFAAFARTRLAALQAD